MDETVFAIFRAEHQSTSSKLHALITSADFCEVERQKLSIDDRRCRNGVILSGVGINFESNMASVISISRGICAFLS
jgi:hypothetical protein